MNHPPTPVNEGIAVPLHSKADCDKLKAEFGVVTRTHRRGATAASKKESHHTLQDKAMKGLISKYSGFAILLSKTEHKVANARQIARNCPAGSGGGGGATTFGQLQKDAAEDVSAALKNRKSRDTGKPMSPAQAKKLGECIVAEAVRETQKVRKRKKRKPLDQNSKVKPVKGCLTAQTLLLMHDGDLLAASRIEEGDLLWATSGTPQHVARVRRCRGPVQRLVLGRRSVALAPQHRVRLATGALRRADTLMAGHVLDTLHGPVRIDAVSQSQRPQALYSIALQAADGAPSAYIGHLGLEVGMPLRELPVAAHLTLGRTRGTREI